MNTKEKFFVKHLSQMLLAGFAATSALGAADDYNWLSEVQEQADGIVWKYVTNNVETLVVGRRGIVYTNASVMNSVLDELATGYEDFENDCFMSAVPPDTSGAISFNSWRQAGYNYRRIRFLHIQQSDGDRDPRLGAAHRGGRLQGMSQPQVHFSRFREYCLQGSQRTSHDGRRQACSGRSASA